MAVCFQMVWRKRKLFVLYFQLSCKFEIVLKKKLDFRVKYTVEPSLGLTSHLTHCFFVLGFFCFLFWKLVWYITMTLLQAFVKISKLFIQECKVQVIRKHYGIISEFLWCLGSKVSEIITHFHKVDVSLQGCYPFPYNPHPKSSDSLNLLGSM